MTVIMHKSDVTYDLYLKKLNGTFEPFLFPEKISYIKKTQKCDTDMSK